MHPNDPALKSFVPGADDSGFPIQNLPYGVFRTPADDKPRVGVRIGEHVLDLKVLEHAGHFEDLFGDTHVFCKWGLNRFMSLGAEAWTNARQRISELLRADNGTLRDNAALREQALVPLEAAHMLLPAEIGDYTDFYSSKQHAYNVGCMFRDPKNALLPNWLWIPVGYHGRASSIVPSGTPVRRPRGQTKADDAEAPTFGPSRLLDFELEMGFFTGPGNTLGEPITIESAERQIFGVTLVNDWSARDIQKWEYVPLGPFLAKNFATTVSPWVTPRAALEPFRTTGPEQDPQPLEYLRIPESKRDGAPAAGWTYDIKLEVALQTEKQREPFVISRSNFKHLYWTMAQQLAHHTVNGCNLRPGDLLASGTISGPTPDSYGSMLELAWRGERPIQLPSGEERKFIQDGDTVIMRAYCEGPAYRLDLGECVGRIM
ncbi:MAG: fumarylacetoacetase [Phycisphaerales bacterium]|nr:fumarylacetoacetase [Phycisphaerales bacterium]